MSWNRHQWIGPTPLSTEHDTNVRENIRRLGDAGLSLTGLANVFYDLRSTTPSGGTTLGDPYTTLWTRTQLGSFQGAPNPGPSDASWRACFNAAMQCHLGNSRLLPNHPTSDFFANRPEGWPKALQTVLYE